MAQGYRPVRVADQIRAEITTMLAREVHDPGIGFLTITHVRVTPDLQVARVFYTTLGNESERRATDKALRRAAPFLRHQIGQRLRLRRVPALEFQFDKSVETQDRVERLLQEIHEAEAAKPDETHDPDRHDD
jgi:ribosome-binding factor A